MGRKAPENRLIPVSGAAGQVVVLRPAVEAGKGYLAENTRRAYFRDWMDFFGVQDLALITHAMVVGATPDQVADFRDQLLEKGLGPGTINRKLTSIRAFFDKMILRGVLTLNPAHPKLVQSPKRGQVHKMEGLDKEEALRFLRAIDRSTPVGRRDYALIMTDLHMGLRRSEALHIRVEEFTTREGRACVVFRSKGEKERIIWVNEDLEKALAPYATDRGTAPGFLFPGKNEGSPLDGSTFWRIVQKYLKAAGITKQIGTHGLRATFIAHNLAAGTPLDEIQRTVGHSRGETTLGYARDFEAIKSRAPKAMEGLNTD